MSNETVFLRFKGEFYNNPKDAHITMFIQGNLKNQKLKEVKVPKSAILFYVPGKKSTDDEILISLTEDELKSLGFPKYRKLRPGTKGTDNLPPRPVTLPPKIEYLLEGFISNR